MGQPITYAILFIASVILSSIILSGCTGGAQAATPTPTPVQTPPPTATPFQTQTPPPSPTPAATASPSLTPTATPPPTPAPTPVPSPRAEQVDIRGFAFIPSSLTVKVGTTVTWTNFDGTAHRIDSDSGSTLSSSTLQNGQSWSFTFSSAGSFPYHCAFHPTMKGTVIVTP